MQCARDASAPLPSKCKQFSQLNSVFTGQHQSTFDGGAANENSKFNDSDEGIAQSQLTHEIVVPSATAAWYDPEGVAQIERDSLPEFFSGLYPSKTPLTYKEYRTFMVSLYRAQPDTYLTATACRRHLSGDVCAIMRIHQFLEKQGLINFNVRPDEKPIAKDLVGDSTFNRVFINAANKHYVQKNEAEYLTNLYETTAAHSDQNTPAVAVQTKAQPVEQPKLIDAGALRKINLISASERPSCSFCKTLVGFTWYETKIKTQEQPWLTLCQKCLANENYPSEIERSNFEQKSVSKEFWSKLDQSVEAQDDAQLAKPSKLSPYNQQKLLSLVLEHGQDWGKIANEAGLKSAKEAFLEFMRIQAPELYSTDKHLEIFAQRLDQSTQPEVPQFKRQSFLDDYFLQCEMLKQFATTPAESLPSQRRKREEKRAMKLMAHQTLLCEFQTVQEEF